MELDQQPMAGRPPAKELIAAMVEARERHVYAQAQYEDAEAKRKAAYERSVQAEQAVKTIPELRDGGVIVMDGKAYLLRQPAGVWGMEKDPDKYTVEIREVAE